MLGIDNTNMDIRGYGYLWIGISVDMDICALPKRG